MKLPTTEFISRKDLHKAVTESIKHEAEERNYYKRMEQAMYEYHQWYANTIKYHGLYTARSRSYGMCKELREKYKVELDIL